MASFFGLSPPFEDLACTEDWTGVNHNGEPFFYYRIKCQLRRGDMIVGEADGSCNSWEKKYRYRSAGRLCPTCGKPTLLRSKGDKPADTSRSGESRLGSPAGSAGRRKAGCGGQFEYNDSRIPQQEAGNMPNPDVAEQVNTILKMAQKRALIAATLIVTGISEHFTQDITKDYTPGEHSYEPPTDSYVQDDPAPQASKTQATKTAELAGQLNREFPESRSGTVKEGGKAGAAPSAKFPYDTASPDERAAFLKSQIPKVTSAERLADISKKVKEVDLGAANYREVMALITETDRKFMAEPELTDLADGLNAATTVEGCDEISVFWQEDSAKLSAEVYNKGVELIARARAAK